MRKGTRCSQRSDSNPWASSSATCSSSTRRRTKVRRPRNEASGWNCGSSTGTRPRASIYAGVPITFGRPVWRVDLFGSTESPAGTLDRAHHHPRFNGRSRSSELVPELSADPVSWLTAELADPDAVLARSGVDPDEVTDADRAGLAAAAPDIVAAVKRMLDGVRDGDWLPAPPEPVAAARTGWL